MGFISTIIIGFIIGVLAKFLHPGNENMGFIVTTILGIAGSFVAALIGQAVGLYQPNEPAGWVASTLAAVLLLVLHARFMKK